MTVRLRPELESLIQKDLERGPYESIDEFVEHAVRLLHDQEEWLSENRDEIAAKIEHGYAQAERGELTDPKTAREILGSRRQNRSKP